MVEREEEEVVVVVVDSNGGEIQEEQVVDPRVDSSGGEIHEQREDGAKKCKRQPVFKYGNYNRYYGYRLQKTMDEDPRLNCLKREWFEGKDCLDVGCNEGFITIAIAQKYMCRSILGVDIDSALIEKAISNLQGEALALDVPKDKLLEGHQEETAVLKTCDETKKRCRERKGQHAVGHTQSLVQRVKFREEQFIEDFPHGKFWKDGKFDTILCLSVTKWIHLNWGDEGLIRLFAKIHHILRPGGILVLEPQPWKSYKRKARRSEATRQCYKSIHLLPEHFTEVLLDKIGFKSVEEVSRAVPNSSLGFDRSIFLYVK